MDRSQTSLSLILACILALSAGAASAQTVTLPRASPHATLNQTFGISQVTIDYHRPRVNDREIWGALVPWDTVWRAGANDNTTITFSHPVQVEGKDLAAGTYGLHMIPGQDRWTVIFSSNSTSWGSFTYNEEEDVLRVKVQPQGAEFAEWLGYGFEDLGANGATAYLHWEKVKVPFRVEANTPELVMANAANELRSQAGFQWQGWVTAATYALQNNVHLEQAAQWAEQAVQRQENGRTLGLQALLLFRLGRGEEAEPVMAKALESGTEAEVNLLGYAVMGAGETEKALEIFASNVRKHPESWNCYDSLGEAQAANGQTKEAIKNYAKARELAPEAQQGRIDSVLAKLRG